MQRARALQEKRGRSKGGSLAPGGRRGGPLPSTSSPSPSPGCYPGEGLSARACLSVARACLFLLPPALGRRTGKKERVSNFKPSPDVASRVAKTTLMRLLGTLGTPAPHTRKKEEEFFFFWGGVVVVVVFPFVVRTHLGKNDPPRRLSFRPVPYLGLLTRASLAPRVAVMLSHVMGYHLLPLCP